MGAGTERVAVAYVVVVVEVAESAAAEGTVVVRKRRRGVRGASVRSREERAG